MKRKIIYTIILLLIIILISPISEDSLPEFYVELSGRDDIKTCSGFQIEVNLVITANHCSNISRVKFTDGVVKPLIKVYRNIEDDVAIYEILEGGHCLRKYPKIGYSYPIGIFRVHSQVNEIKEPLFFLIIDQNLLKDSPKLPEIFTTVDVFYPIGKNTIKGHSGSAILQNNKIVGLVFGHALDRLNVKQMYGIQGSTIRKHLTQYKRNLEIVKKLYSTTEQNNYFYGP